MKKTISVFFALVLAMLVAVPAFAADTPVITYNGGNTLAYTDGSGNALTGNSDFGTAFKNMYPGVTYTQNMKLVNSDTKATVRFYMDLSVLKTLMASGLDGAGYLVTLTSGSDVLFSSDNGTRTGTLIGGSGSTGELADLNKSLYSSDGNGILVATLQPGASTVVSLSIGADATMSNAYQAATGTLSFQFFGEIVPEPTVSVINKVETVYVNNGVQTGDARPIYVVAGVLVLAVVVFLVLGKKKDKKSA